MITFIKLLFVAMILAALYGLLLLCVALPFVLWKEWGKLWEERRHDVERSTNDYH